MGFRTIGKTGNVQCPEQKQKQNRALLFNETVQMKYKILRRAQVYTYYILK